MSFSAWDPAISEEVVVTIPLPCRGIGPRRFVVPSVNVTVPVGAEPLPLTAIVMVTESPNNDRFLEEVIDRTAAALLTASVAVPVTVL